MTSIQRRSPVASVRRAAGLGERGHLDGLLGVARAAVAVPRPPGATARRTGGRRVVCWSTSQPSSSRPSSRSDVVAERAADHDHGLGEHGVGVGEALLGPRPRGRRRRERAQDASGVGEEPDGPPCRRATARSSCAGTEGGVGHRARPRASATACASAAPSRRALGEVGVVDLARPRCPAPTGARPQWSSDDGRRSSAVGVARLCMRPSSRRAASTKSR